MSPFPKEWALGKTGKSGCDVGVDIGDPALPVAGHGKLSGIRKSRNSRWRAATLIGVHLLIAAHATHFLIAGETLSPVEPSESMYTLELGYVNAGFIFFAVALLATLVFGRFFCGWGCHIVAVQDLCGWIMKKLGVRPRPFRSRLMLWVPLIVALYMFVWPALKRVVMPAAVPEFPGFTNHLATSGFWDTFPGPVFAVLTLLTCGVAAVYFMGAKGFCSYGCPYGGFFGIVDQVSPGRIVVNDDCEQCGHCTATCTSNVRVHDEVRRFGMVVDPGCMKCMDCVSVCPKNALGFGFSRPSLFKRDRSDKPARRLYDLGFGAELMLLTVTLGAGWGIFRGLYDGPPLLMSVALGGLTAFLTLKLWHLAARGTVRLQNLNLKLGGSWQPAGRVFAAAATLWLLFAAHSGIVQWHRAWGGYHLNRTEATQADVFSGAFRAKSYSERHRISAERSFRHFRAADGWGLFDVVEVKLGVAWGHLLEGKPAEAETAVRAALAIAPGNTGLNESLQQVLLSQGKFDEVVAAKRAQIDAGEATVTDHFQLAGMLAELQRYDEAVAEYRACLDLGRDTLEVRYNLGGLLRRMNRPLEAIEQLAQASALAPNDFDTHVELGLAHAAAGDATEAITALQRAIDIDPQRPEAQLHLPGLIREIESSATSPAQ